MRDISAWLIMFGYARKTVGWPSTEGKMENKEVSITLPVQAWNVVMNALGQRPYVEVAELIANIKKQAEDQISSVSQKTEQGE